MKKIAFIGVGNMGAAIVRAGLQSKIFLPDHLSLIHSCDQKAKKIQQDYNGVSCSTELEDIPSIDVIFLAVKPQSFSDLVKSFNGKLTASTVVVSIMAGVTTETIATELGVNKIVRTMPNLANMISEGVTAIFPTTEVNQQEIEFVKKLFDQQGFCFQINEEAQMDAVTAISGSGPAYAYYFIEALQSAAEGFGFDAAIAKKLAEQTFSGSISFLQSSEETAAELRAKVTSKGGTTAAAIASLDLDGVMEKFVQAVSKAKARSEELGKEN